MSIIVTFDSCFANNNHLEDSLFSSSLRQREEEKNQGWTPWDGFSLYVPPTSRKLVGPNPFEDEEIEMDKPVWVCPKTVPEPLLAPTAKEDGITASWPAFVPRTVEEKQLLHTIYAEGVEKAVQTWAGGILPRSVRRRLAYCQ